MNELDDLTLIIYRGAGSLGDRGFPRIGGIPPRHPGPPFPGIGLQKKIGPAGPLP